MVDMDLERRCDFLSQHNVETFTFPRILAEALKYLKIPVSSNRPMGNHFTTFKDQNFEHEFCIPTHSPHDDPQTMIENLERICGDETVHFKYSYKHPMFASSEPGRIRLLLENREFNRKDTGKKYIKKHNASGTLAFRFDSVLSHLSMLNGAFPNLPYGLKPGQLLPAQNTDESVKGGLYFYGSLWACRQAGQGKWKVPQNMVDPQTERFCNLGVITILQVTNVITGPKSPPGQWAKSGSSPNNAYVVGCIIPEEQIRAFKAVMDLTSYRSQIALISGLKTVLQTPSDYLSSTSYSFLRRYVAGGVFLAHAEHLPLRCVTFAKFNPLMDDSYITEQLLETCISSYIRDDSFSDERNQSVVKAMTAWLLGGLSNEKVIRDTGTLECYTIRKAVDMVYDNKFKGKMDFAPCELYDAYISAIRSTTDLPHEVIPASKRRKIISYDVASESIFPIVRSTSGSIDPIERISSREELKSGDYVSQFDTPFGSLVTTSVHTPLWLKAEAYDPVHVGVFAGISGRVILKKCFHHTSTIYDVKLAIKEAEGIAVEGIRLLHKDVVVHNYTNLGSMAEYTSGKTYLFMHTTFVPSSSLDFVSGSTEAVVGDNNMEVQVRKGMNPGGLPEESFGGLREMQEDVHKDSPEVGERQLNKNQLILFRQYILDDKNLPSIMRSPFEEVLRECMEGANGGSGETVYSIKKRMIDRWMQHQNRKTMYESGCDTLVETTTTDGGSNSVGNSDESGSRMETAGSVSTEELSSQTTGSVSTEELSSQDSGRAFDETESIAYFLSKHTALAVYRYLDGFQTLPLSPGKFVKKRRKTMMKFLTKELKTKTAPDLTYLVKAVSKHIISDRYSWGLWHPICQVGADGLRMVFGLNVHIEVAASDIVRAANNDHH